MPLIESILLILGKELVFHVIDVGFDFVNVWQGIMLQTTYSFV